MGLVSDLKFNSVGNWIDEVKIRFYSQRLLNEGTFDQFSRFITHVSLTISDFHGPHGAMYFSERCVIYFMYLKKKNVYQVLRVDWYCLELVYMAIKLDDNTFWLSFSNWIESKVMMLNNSFLC